MVVRRFPATLHKVIGAVVIGVASLWSTGLLAADCDIPSDLVLSDGYLIGRELLALPDEALASYIIGFINATSLSVAFGAEQACIEQAHKNLHANPCQHLSRCSSGPRTRPVSGVRSARFAGPRAR